MRSWVTENLKTSTSLEASSLPARLALGPVAVVHAIMDRVVEAFRTEGADAWYKPGAAARFLGPDRDPESYEQVMDIVDVWFESGSTHAFVLGETGGRGLPGKADLYLEGSDQHRGWFHSSLLESCGTRGRAPYDVVLTHGFVLDAERGAHGLFRVGAGAQASRVPAQTTSRA